MKYGKTHLYHQPVNELTEMGPRAEQWQREAAKQGHKLPPLLRLHIGEPSFQTPEHIRLAARRSIMDERQTYGPTGGHWWLRELVADKITQRNGYHVGPEQVAITMGGTGALQAAMHAIIEPGDEVLIPDPCWSTYFMQLNTCGAIARPYPLDPVNNWLPDVDQLKTLVTPRTRMLLINTPGNPSGAVFPAALVAELMAFVQRHDLYLLSDECYDELVFDLPHVSPATFLSHEEFERGHFIGVYTFSKTYAMTGWRIGYVASSTALIKTILDVQNATLTNLNTALQRGAEAALMGPRDEIAAMHRHYHQQRDMVVDRLKAAQRYVYTPQGAFYALIDIASRDESPRDSYSFTMDLLHERNIVVAPGSAFGNRTRNHYIRVSFAASTSDLEQGIQEICHFADNYEEKDPH